MADGGVVFSDGVETDAIPFRAGIRVEVTPSAAPVDPAGGEPAQRCLMDRLGRSAATLMKRSPTGLKPA